MPLTEIAPLELVQRRPTGPRMTMARAAGGDAGRLAPLITNRRRTSPTARENRPVGNEERSPFLSVNVLRTQYLDYLGAKVDEIEEQKEARRYYHGAHYTAERIRILRAPATRI